MPVHARTGQSLGSGRIEQQVVDPQPGVPPPRPTRVVPEREDLFAWVQVPKGVRPPLREQSPVRLAGLRPEQGAGLLACRIVDVEFLGEHVVIARQDDRVGRVHQFRGPSREPL